MKKIVSILLIGCLLALSACGEVKSNTLNPQGNISEAGIINNELPNNTTEVKSDEYKMYMVYLDIYTDMPAKYTMYEESTSSTFYGGSYLGSRYVAITNKRTNTKNTYKAYYKKGDDEVISVNNIKEQTFVNLHGEIEILNYNLKEEDVTVNGIKAIRYEGTATNTKFAKDSGRKNSGTWDVYVVGYSFEFGGEIIDIQGMVIDDEQLQADKDEVKKYVEHAMQTMRSKP